MISLREAGEGGAGLGIKKRYGCHQAGIGGGQAVFKKFGSKRRLHCIILHNMSDEDACINRNHAIDRL